MEVSGQLSNQAIKERIDALWSLTRDNVSTTSWAHNSPASEPTIRTPKRVCRRLDPAKLEELIHGYADGVPVDELAARFQVDQAPSRNTPGAMACPVGRPGWGRGSPRKRPSCIWPVSRLPSWLTTLVSPLTRWLSPCAGPGSPCAHDEDGPVSW